MRTARTAEVHCHHNDVDNERSAVRVCLEEKNLPSRFFFSFFYSLYNTPCCTRHRVQCATAHQRSVHYQYMHPHLERISISMHNKQSKKYCTAIFFFFSKRPHLPRPRPRKKRTTMNSQCCVCASPYQPRPPPPRVPQCLRRAPSPLPHAAVRKALRMSK